jgi:glycosyltransferase involved in cell wall biosynthesis
MKNKKNQTVLFYSSVKNKIFFDTQQFYQTDIQLLKELGYNILLSNRLRDSLLFWKYDIVFAYFYRWSFFVALCGRLFLKKIYFTGGIDALDRNYVKPSIYLIQKIFFKLCYFPSTVCIIVSESDKNNVKKIFGNRLPNKIAYSEHTINVGSFDPDTAKKKIFTTIAWMGEQGNVIRKGLDKALELFAYLITKPEFSEYKFYIIGYEGEGSNYIKEIAGRLNLSDRVIFTGAITEPEKIKMLKESKYYFQLSQYEGFGIAAIEALAAKNIVIHSAMGGLKYSVKNYGIVYNLNEYTGIEHERIYAELLKFDESLLDLAYMDVKSRFSNVRRREELRNIINGLLNL